MDGRTLQQVESSIADLAEELLELMDGMDVADYPMIPVVCELIQQDLEARRIRKEALDA